PCSLCFCSHHTPATDISALSLHDALPIFRKCDVVVVGTNAIRVAHNNDALELHHLVGHDIGGEIQFSQAFGRDRRAVIGEKHVISEEHTSELQSRENLVCRLLLEKKNRST